MMIFNRRYIIELKTFRKYCASYLICLFSILCICLYVRYLKISFEASSFVNNIFTLIDNAHFYICHFCISHITRIKQYNTSL